MKRIIYYTTMFVSLIVVFSCEMQHIPSDKNILTSKESIQREELNDPNDSIFEEEIIPEKVDKTSPIFLELLNKYKANLKSTQLKSDPYVGHDAGITLIDLRDSPVNILVLENTGRGKYLTAKRSKHRRWFKNYYTNDPARFEEKQTDSNLNSQTFYLSQNPLTGQYIIKTKFDGTDYYMVPGHYNSSPNDQFLFGNDKPSEEYIKLYKIIPTNDYDGAFYLQNFIWKKRDDGKEGIWHLVLGCNHDSRSYFDIFKGIGSQLFSIAPVEDFEIEKIEYGNEYSATLKKQPDFIVTWTTINDTSITQQVTTQFGKTATKTSNFSRTRSFSFSITGTLSVNIPCIVGEKINTSTSSSESATWGKSETFSDTRNYNFQINIPARRKVVAKAVVSRYLISVPYTLYLRGKSTGKIIRVGGKWEGVDCTNISTSYTEYDIDTHQLVRTRIVQS